ncbi:HpaII family restriction endonuclease, partial [Staphylococcus simulans]|uniref:HpaII family restriction endonuclease n=1 Tax=Staphylococcus simulans TaxID=1286 RepID=UPI000D1E9C2B
SIYCNKIKADSNDKSDINLKIIDINTGYIPEVGFSIKSKLGSSATLLNAGKSTNFSFAFYNMSDDTQNKINSMFKENSNTKKKSLDLRGRINYLEDNEITYKFHKTKNDKFNDNLVMIDSYMDRIIAEMLLYFYRDNIRKSEDLISEIVKENPLKYGNKYAYEYKFKKFLTAIALGMRPATLWNGMDEATGGYIVVNKKGEPLTYHIHNRNYFEDYLIKNTKFETASTSKHKFGSIYEEDNMKFIDLNLQISFI